LATVAPDMHIVLGSAVGEATGKRDGGDDVHAVHIGVLTWLVHFADDIERAISGDFRTDMRIAQVAVGEAGRDHLLEIMNRETGGLNLTDERQTHEAGAVDLEFTTKIVFAINDEANLVASAEVIPGIKITQAGRHQIARTCLRGETLWRRRRGGNRCGRWRGLR